MYTSLLNNWTRKKLTSSSMNMRTCSGGNLLGSVVKSRYAWYRSISFHMTGRHDCQIQGRPDVEFGIEHTFERNISFSHTHHLLHRFIDVMITPSYVGMRSKLNAGGKWRMPNLQRWNPKPHAGCHVGNPISSPYCSMTLFGLGPEKK